MFKFWSLILEPVLRSIAARQIIEIGVADGECTQLLLEYCRDVKGRLDYIDPVQDFDLALFQQRYGTVGNFHQCTSLEALPRLQAADAVLIDGDHNWYTVFNELKLLETCANNSGSGFPLVFFHDIGWPYGRRDLYYAPERLPSEYLLPHAQKGMVPGVAELADEGGLNPQFYNALQEGGARNGVLTAVEDFIQESKIGTLYVIPILSGLGILVPERLQRNEVLMAEIHQWQSNQGLTTLLNFLERERINEICSVHADLVAQERATAGWQQEATRLQGELERLSAAWQQEYTRLQDELERLSAAWQQEYTRLQDEMQGRLQAVLSSRSWRWTRPLRGLGAVLERFGKRAG